jgi:hypothetical protein
MSEAEIKRIPITDASVSDLREFASTIMGLEIKENAPKPAIIAQLKSAGYAADYITLTTFAQMPTVSHLTENGSPQRRATGRKRRDLDGNDYEVFEEKINVHTSEQPGGDKPFPVSVNGVTMLLPRGQDIWVPTEFIEALNNAVYWVYPEWDGTGEGGLSEPQNVKAYPYSRV